MSKKSREPLAGLKHALTKREELIHIIIVAAFLAMGIDLLGSFLFTKFSENSSGLLWFGTVLIVLALLYLSFTVLRAKDAAYDFESVVPIDKRKKHVTVIPGYEITQDIRRALNAVFLENEALELAWKSESPVNQLSPVELQKTSQNEGREGQDSGSSQPLYAAVVKMEVSEQLKPAAILREVFEFVVLNQLSLHLSEYFGRSENQGEQIMEYNRKHVPGLLLENRILSLLTTPLEDRAIFVKAKLTEWEL